MVLTGYAGVLPNGLKVLFGVVLFLGSKGLASAWFGLQRARYERKAD